MTKFNGIQEIKHSVNINKNFISDPPKQHISTKTISEEDIKTASDAATSVGLATLAISQKNAKKAQATKEENETNSTKENSQTIVTKPAQLSLFHMNDFHSQSERMERAYTASEDFKDGKLDDDEFFDDSMPIDKLKLCSGDMFLGDNPQKIAMVNEFLNSTGVVANVVGNHECDAAIEDFAKLIQGKKYRLVSTNMHPNKEHDINKVISESFITEINGNKYGIIGASPIDFMKHTNRPEQVSSLNMDDLETTIKEIQADIGELKKKGVNKIILLSHLGSDIDVQIAKNINDVDVILGGHTHTLFKDAKLGENVFYSPKGEPVLIVQSGKDGEYIGMPNLKFNEQGQVTEIDYKVLRTDDFERNEEIKARFQDFFGRAELLGTIKSVENLNSNFYINENPHANFMLDCLKDELDTDIAIVNSAGLRSQFTTGDITSYDIDNVSPFNNNIITIQVSEKELLFAIKEKIKETVLSPTKRPGILQVSGLKYEFDKTTGKLLSLKFVDKKGNEKAIDIENPTEQLYSVAINEFSAKDNHSGLGLAEKANNPVRKYEHDIKKFVIDWLKKNKEPICIKTDGRIVGK